MIRNILDVFTSATRTFFGNLKNLAAFTFIYALLVYACYLFFTTPEARIWQVGLTILLTLLIPILFFVLQVMSVKYANADNNFSELLRRGFTEFWKLFLISLPFLLLFGLAIWGLIKLKNSMTTRIENTPTETAAQIKAADLQLKNVARGFWAIHGLLMYFILPLFSIQLWITTLRDGCAQTFKRIFSAILQAFAPRSVVTYLLGFLVFAVIPYFIITTRTPIKSPWMDLSVLGIRIALALLIALVGWIVTVGALTGLTPEKPEVTQS